MKRFILITFLIFLDTANAHNLTQKTCSCNGLAGNQPVFTLVIYSDNEEQREPVVDSWFWWKDFGYPHNSEAINLAKEACINKAGALIFQAKTCHKFIE